MTMYRNPTYRERDDHDVPCDPSAEKKSSSTSSSSTRSSSSSSSSASKGEDVLNPCDDVTPGFSIAYAVNSYMCAAGSRPAGR